MQKLAEISIRRPVFGTMIVLALVVVGIAGHLKLGVDRSPHVDVPQIYVGTRLPGASPVEVESLISQPIEEQVNTVEGITELRSISGVSSSFVIIQFDLSRKVNEALEDVRNQLADQIKAEKAQAEPSAKIAKIAESLDRLEKRQVAASAPATTVAALQPPAHQDVTGSVATDKLQAKPPVAEGWKLHEFFGGRAVVENRMTGNLFEVGPGSNLPGLGRVETIRREDNRIVIVTPKGIISAQLDPRRQPYYPSYR